MADKPRKSPRKAPAKKSAAKPARKAPANAPRNRRRLLAWIAAGAMALAVLLAVVALVIFIRRPDTPPAPEPPVAGVPPTGSVPSRPHKPRPASQPADCPDVQLVSVPGTWESSRTDDPLNPTEFPRALLLSVTRPIAGEFGAERVQTYTVPYIAQFRNPLVDDGQMDYNKSRAEGKKATVDAMTAMNDRCPLTSYVLVGFSQGAVIAGDVAGDIGNGRGPVDEDLVLGVTLIADGRRQMGPDAGVDVPPTPPGQGAEVTLHELPLLSGLGLTMTGARDGGFGDLSARTNEICARGDLICAAPREAFSIAKLPGTLETLAGGAAAPVHALYATTDFWEQDGKSATEWTLDWARGVIADAPRPPHG